MRSPLQDSSSISLLWARMPCSCDTGDQVKRKRFQSPLRLFSIAGGPPIGGGECTPPLYRLLGASRGLIYLPVCKTWSRSPNSPQTLRFQHFAGVEIGIARSENSVRFSAFFAFHVALVCS